MSECSKQCTLCGELKCPACTLALQIRPAPPECNALFCILPAHEGDQHTDVTGHTWTEPTPSEPVIARSYDWAEVRS